MLNLFKAIETRDLTALECSLMQGESHPYSDWSTTPPTMVDRYSEVVKKYSSKESMTRLAERE
jgi:hypothetical protein